MTRRNAVEFYRANGWYITSPYGPRTGQFAGFHRGIDFGGRPCGYSVLTPFDGVITAARTSGMGTWGNTVCQIIDGTDGKVGSLNAHLQRIDVKVNQIVKKGDRIGTNGGTNHRGPNYDCHIHYEILNQDGTAPWRGSLWGNPAKFWVEQGDPGMSELFNKTVYIRNVTIHNIRIRERPGVQGTILGVVKPGQTIQVKNHDLNGSYAGGYYWWYISANGLSGFVAEDFFEKVHAPDPAPVDPPELEQEPDGPEEAGPIPEEDQDQDQATEEVPAAPVCSLPDQDLEDIAADPDSKDPDQEKLPAEKIKQDEVVMVDRGLLEQVLEALQQAVAWLTNLLKGGGK